MKKIILLATVLLGINAIGNAQSTETENKNFRFGLKGDLSVNWLSPENKNELQSGGVGTGYAWGLQMEFKVNRTIAFVSGVNLLSAGYKLNYTDGIAAGKSFYVLDANQDFVDISDRSKGQYDTTKEVRYQLNDRSFRGNYVNIPFTFKMRTNEIGYMTYFGEFGANINILTKGKVSKDEVLISGNAVTKEDLTLSKSMGLVNMGVKVGGGAEYNISGTTALFFALHYNLYFLSTTKTKDKYLQKPDLLSTSGEFKSAGQKAVPGAVSLSVGILF